MTRLKRLLARCFVWWYRGQCHCPQAGFINYGCRGECFPRQVERCAEDHE